MSIKLLCKSSNTILNQLNDFVSQLDKEVYCKTLPLLSGNSLGKHIRHILELYQELFNGLPKGKISYDDRQRDILIEQNPKVALELISELLQKTGELSIEIDLNLGVDYGDEEVIVGSTLSRELAYNIEHAIHHMAIIQICVKHSFPAVQLSEDFGLAYSTIKYNKSNVHANLSATSE